MLRLKHLQCGTHKYLTTLVTIPRVISCHLGLSLGLEVRSFKCKIMRELLTSDLQLSPGHHLLIEEEQILTQCGLKQVKSVEMLIQCSLIETRHLLKRKYISIILTTFLKNFWNK